MIDDTRVSSQISPVISRLGEAADTAVREQWTRIDNVQRRVMDKVISSFCRHHVSTGIMDYSTGYGYASQSRQTVDLVWADALDAPAAMVRPQIMTGTHALFLCLRSLLSPGDSLTSITGTPYGTLITGLRGTADHKGLLASRNITYAEVDPFISKRVDLEVIRRELQPTTAVVLIQRSRGYSNRPGLTINAIADMTEIARDVAPDAVILVDNCYGEFVDDREPSAVGADIVAGSLLKNPGAGLAPTGGYIAGRTDLIDQAAAELTAPGQGREVGPLLDAHRWLLQALFVAPHVVAESLKAAVWAAWVAERMGIPVHPTWDERRGDIVQTLALGSEQAVLSFCHGVQSAGPLDSLAMPVGAPYPGLDCDVVMAGGTFIQGSSIEFSADAPMMPPYTVFVQGGLYFAHARLGYELGLSRLLSDGLWELSP